MRALLHVDVVTLARVLLSVEAEKRSETCDQLFDRAHAADKYRKRFGRIHMNYGRGDLASACWDEKKRSEPFLSDRDYAQCMRVILDRVLKGA
jgi:hypothetical protein